MFVSRSLGLFRAKIADSFFYFDELLLIVQKTVKMINVSFFSYRATMAPEQAGFAGIFNSRKTSCLILQVQKNKFVYKKTKSK